VIAPSRRQFVCVWGGGGDLGNPGLGGGGGGVKKETPPV